MASYTLDNGEARHKQTPDTFEMPPRIRRENLVCGDIVKLIFNIAHDKGNDIERMWVIVKETTSGGYVGVLDNDPYCTQDLKSGATVLFGVEHVIQIYED